MKWLIFAGDNYYPRGGWDDYVSSAGSLEEALDFAALLLKSWDWVHAVELESGMQIDVQKAARDQFADERSLLCGSDELAVGPMGNGGGRTWGSIISRRGLCRIVERL
jgi:hypothetical protein